MKKLLAIIILCVLLLPAHVLAVEGCVVINPLPGTLGDAPAVLRVAWGNDFEKAPDVGGIYWDNDNERVCVLLVDGGTQARKQEIIALVGNADWVSFESCKYSYTQLKAAWQEISEDMKSRNGVVGVGIGKDHVMVNVLKEALETVGYQYRNRYGDMVQIEEGAIPKTDEKGRVIGVPKTGDMPGAIWLFPMALGCLCLGLRKRAGG